MIFESIANPVIKRPLLFGYVPLNEENAIMQFLAVHINIYYLAFLFIIHFGYRLPHRLLMSWTVIESKNGTEFHQFFIPDFVQQDKFPI